MQLYKLDEFMGKTMGGWPLQADMSPYINKSFECACGMSHTFDNSSLILRELPGLRFVIKCPEADAVTCVKVTFFTMKFKSLFGMKED